MNCCPIVELRQYTLHPGKRDILIELFDREFVESQEALGMRIIGQFRDLDNPDRFVWLRGFADMAGRAEALRTFYGGPVWKEHRDAANATMIDSDNVLLLRRVRPTSGFELGAGGRRPPITNNLVPGIVIATIYYFNAPVSMEFIDFFELELSPVLRASDTSVLAYFINEDSVNNFPALPVREGEHVFVWFSRVASLQEYKQFGVAAVARQLTSYLKRNPEILRLLPTSRSQLRGTPVPHLANY
ncbi:MAG TPA: NIPSNAP family protein [Chthoniobacterales bacterium]